MAYNFGLIQYNKEKKIIKFLYTHLNWKLGEKKNKLKIFFRMNKKNGVNFYSIFFAYTRIYNGNTC